MNRIAHTADFRIKYPADKLFPLFSAEGEKLWVPGWDYENIMGTTELRENYVFLTTNHDHAATSAIWIVKNYQPEDYLVEFYKVEPEEKVGFIKVHCTSLSESDTKVEVTYEYIALSEKGKAFIKDFTTEDYTAFIGEWGELLSSYLKL
ncbi:hypothetical protein [Gracilimonas mengyeensis]|uniref:Activator of Hsp90 ATPase homolog 1-like protein n=1 Tax=Gracilimonas mengyeensis TaxID=1302730 RepID=A0A521ESB4_9BACT|nr:hypothetical protein [Gracilimonas mengyeensis]SMO86836.1 hypothetical protein SAMN06265219_113101 [Gracilimonas mengyeensis]